MALYMTQFSYTRQATATMAKHPEDRSVGLKTIVEKLGGHVLGLYFCFGDFDGVGIVEVPDSVTELALLMAINAAGHLKTTKTTPLFTMDETVKAMEKASKLVYKGPEG